MGDKRKTFNTDALTLGIGLLSIPTLDLLITSLLFLFGLSVNPFIFPLSVLLSSFLIWLLLKKKKQKVLPSLLFHLSFIIIALVVSAFFYDNTYDGQRYHQEIVSLLKEGWNPIYESSGTTSLWVNHYAKGIETIAATIFSTTGNVEAGKAVNFIIIFASLFFACDFLDKNFSCISRNRKYFLSCLLAFAPITIVQLFTFYIDWCAYSLLLILVTSLINMSRNFSKYSYGVIISVIFLSATIKFNIFFWILFAVFCFMVYLLITKKYLYLKRLFIAAVIGCITGVFIGGVNPYITNIISHQTPFYPLMGEGKVDIMTNNTPVVLKDKNRAETVLISIFSYPNSEFKDENDLNLIFTSKPSLNNVLHSGRTAVTVGGYGLLFGWVLVASVLFYIIVYDKKRKDTAYYNAFLLLLFGSLFILPSGWWGRYVPFFYAFPLIILLYGESYRYKKWIRYFTNIMYFILAVDIIIAVPIAGGISLYKKKIVNDYIENFSELKEPVKIDFAGNTSFRLKLEKANVPYEEVPEEELDTTIFSPPIFVLSSQLFNKQSDETNN